MILITGGCGFVGRHTARALLDRDQPCVLVQRRPSVVPPELAGSRTDRVVIAEADVTDYPALRAVVKRYPVTGIVHLAGSVPWPPSSGRPVATARSALRGLLNVFQVACDHDIPRVAVASTIGVFGGVSAADPFIEDQALSLAAVHPIPTFKKVGELLGNHIANATGLEVVNLRISPWGPGSNPRSRFTPIPHMIAAAVGRSTPDFSTLAHPPYAEDGLDMCYIRDCARAIALLQLAPQLSHRTYNVATGAVLTNQAVADAIQELVPGFRIELPRRGPRDGQVLRTCLDINRLRADTGYEPEYDTRSAVADYLRSVREGTAPC